MNPDNLRAIGLMVGSMAAFAAEDMLIKVASAALPTAQILTVLALGGAVIFATLCRARGLPLAAPAFRHPLVLTRNGAEIVATLSYVTALGLVPLSLNTAILQATPLFVTMGAALWLRETVGWRRWTAVGVGLAGVLVMLRPGLEGFRPPALLAAFAALMLAVRDVASRRIPPEIPSLQLSFWAYLSLTPAAMVLLVLGPGPVAGDAPAWIATAGAVGIGVFAYSLLVGATRIGDVATVIPFRYSRLLFAMVLGVVLLGERPDLLTLLGAGLVVGSGLYALWRERRLRRGLPTRARGA
ncbi:DMT family transporter [Palleronia sediminis]|uniref:DMT family transporter n=1 Tax=Palleronia sediminis TaxID=2547833 RepID=A0A4R6AE78_9RHOB|nr:DMT family transporter [Palleronia sediminis]TDL79523.1 DMT family transporter [Palleronia sediminis]